MLIVARLLREMYFDKNMSFWKVSGKTDTRFEISVNNCIWQHLAKICFDIFSDVQIVSELYVCVVNRVFECLIDDLLPI